jgi:hypothetical protein
MDNEAKALLWQALNEWVLYVIAKKELATPEEIAALPEAAKVLFDYSPAFILPHAKVGGETINGLTAGPQTI